MLSTFASSRAITEYFGPVFNAWDWFGHPQGNKDVLKTYFAYPHVDAALKFKKKKNETVLLAWSPKQKRNKLGKASINGSGKRSSLKRRFLLKNISRNVSSFLLSITAKSDFKAQFSTLDLAFLELNK